MLIINDMFFYVIPFDVSIVPENSTLDPPPQKKSKRKTFIKSTRQLSGVKIKC